MQKSIMIQNADVTAKPEHYKDLKDDELLVYSTFYTIQGEGPMAGVPALFIRLAGCNFGSKKTHCQGCDTKFFLADGVKTRIQTLIAKALQDVGVGGLIVVTGGEPCLQDNLVIFCKLAANQGFEVQIETNGTQTRVTQQCSENQAFIVCSPKASSKGYGKFPPPVLEGDTTHALKFVVTTDEKDPHHEIPEWAFTWVRDTTNPERKLYVSPLTVYLRKTEPGEIVSAWDTTLVDHKATAMNYAYAAKLALENRNLIVSTQQHTFLSLE